MPFMSVAEVPGIAFAISLWNMDFWQIPNVGAPNFFWCQVYVFQAPILFQRLPV